MKSTIIALSAAIVLTAGSFAGAAYLDNFENTNSLANNYNQADTTNGNTFINVSTSPTIGTNSIKANANNTLTYKTSTFSLPVGKSVTTSIYVNQRTASSAGNVLVQLGFGNAATDTFSSATTARSIFSRLVSDDTANNNTQYHLASDNKFTTSAASENSGYPTVKLTGGFGGSNNNPVWYLYSLTLSRTDATTFTAYSRLQAVGATGTETPGAVLVSYTGTYTNADFGTLADAGTLYAAIRSNTNSGALRLDNFSVSDPVTTPEPAAAGAIGVGALLIGKRRRKSM